VIFYKLHWVGSCFRLIHWTLYTFNRDLLSVTYSPTSSITTRKPWQPYIYRYYENKPHPIFFFFYISHIFMFSRLYLYSALYICKTNNCSSLFTFCSQFTVHGTQAVILLTSADSSIIYMLACKMASLLHLSFLAPQEGREGPMWWWRGMHTPQSHALCCGSCGQHRLYHQTSRLGANQSSSANCRGTKGERKQHACFTMMLVPFMMTNWRTQLRSFPILRIKVIKPWSKITLTVPGPN